ncbi:retrovirus-related Pol polyprotein from transposon 17.6 [Trichonephila clavipes]|nr:retrovirus-related Pol polyprotein from transposon 17.6 [Trichonephila clavipes]
MQGLLPHSRNASSTVQINRRKFQELFSRHRKSPNGTWKDYYFEGWLNELKIDSFEGLKNLMIADQMKKRCSPECKEHYLDIWEELISPEMLADKLEAFDNIRRSLPSGPRRYVKASEIVNDGRQVSFRKPERPPKREYSHQVPNERSPLRCYDCGKQGEIKSRCPTCNLNASQRTDVATNHFNTYTAQTRSPRLTLIDITFSGIKGCVCADTGSSHSIAGERMFQIFKDKGLFFQETTLAMSLADGQQTTGEALTTQVMVEIEGRSVLTKFIILPKAKGNRTLLGTDFLSSAGLVLDVKNTCWYFWDNPTHKYPFGEELDTPSIVEKMSSNTCHLREGEGGKTYISTIDLKSGYHQVNVNPADRDKTAFVCPFGTYRFKRMPFGLKNSPATFQRLMEIFRRGLPVLAYLDDIIIMSLTFEQHLADLEAVFKRLMDFKLRANREKCLFTCSSVKYLGLWITPQGIEVDHEKTSAILGIPPPKNVKQLQSFLQTCSWYRKFIANFSEIVRPLSNLTKKKAFWKWSEEEEKAFQTLKQCLVSPPILKQADFSKPFLIRTDASNYALRAVLLQEDKIKPLIPLRKRGRPPKVPQTPGSSSGRHRNQRGRILQLSRFLLSELSDPESPTRTFFKAQYRHQEFEYREGDTVQLWKTAHPGTTIDVMIEKL